MGTGAFRDTSAAIERVAALTEDNDRLAKENAELRERIEQLETAEDNSAGAQETRRLRKERQDLRDELEKMRVANIAAVNRMKNELKDQKRNLERAVLDLEVERDTLKSELDASGNRKFARDALLADVESARMEVNRLTTERDGLLRKLKLKTEAMAVEGPLDDNRQAFLQRVVEERDELARDLKALRGEKERDEHNSSKRGVQTLMRGLGRLFRR